MGMVGEALLLRRERGGRRAAAGTAGEDDFAPWRRWDGRRVELWGDVTGWVPVDCRKVSRHLWGVVLVMTPGVHRIAMRTDDGPWQAVAGLPVTHDEFGGEVGLLVVE